MPGVARDTLSISRPGPLRLAGFACTAIGALLIGLGATWDWATVHVPGVTGTPISPFKGVDVWEGKIALFAGITILVLVIASRLLAGRAAARGVAVIIVALGLGVAALAASDVMRADTRFRADDGLERIARSVSVQLGLPFQDVLAQLKRIVPKLEIAAASGTYVTIAGGVLASIGGVLGFVWASRRPGLPPNDGVAEAGAAGAPPAG
ncbi:MAG: hypothetical protein ABI879_02210 [Actinomycetota bacterium]